MTPHVARRISVLNVEDNEASRFAKSEELRRAGYTVLEAVNGREALLMAATASIDLIVLDTVLPDMSGFEVCRRLKENPATSNIPVLQVSALLVSDEDRVEGLEGGADGYLPLPFGSNVFLSTVRSLVRVRVAEHMLADALEAERRAREEAEAATRLKDQFLATVSHELRTPLNSIAGWLWRLRQPDITPEVFDRALASLERNTSTQTRLIDDLLDISRIVSGRLQLSVGPVRLGPTVRAALDTLQAEIEAKHLGLQVSLTADDELHGDAERLQQIVINLISNAIHHTPDGGTLNIQLTCEDGWLTLAVSDTGVGLDAEALQYIFEPFRQVDGPARTGRGGLGLGLAIVRQIATMHGGHVTAQSAGPGRGATFTVKLPAASGLARTRYPAPLAPGAELNGLRVLVIEDEADARELLATMLEAAGASVRTVSEPDEALNACSDEPFDLLVSDIGLPQIDGYRLLARLRAEGIQTPAVAVTAYATIEDRQRALDAGFAAHVAKPVEAGTLIMALSRVVAAGQSRDGAASPEAG